MGAFDKPPFNATPEDWRRFLDVTGKELKVFVSHSPDGKDKIRATSLEDLKAGRFWGFEANGQSVYPPAWFLNAVKLK